MGGPRGSWFGPDGCNPRGRRFTSANLRLAPLCPDAYCAPAWQPRQMPELLLLPMMKAHL